MQKLQLLLHQPTNMENFTSKNYKLVDPSQSFICQKKKKMKNLDRVFKTSF